MKQGFICLSHPRIRTQEIDNFIRNSSLTVGYEINIGAQMYKFMTIVPLENLIA